MKWITKNIYVDIETGEVLEEIIAKKLYITLKKIRHAKQQKNATIITFTNECRRNPQGRIF